MSKTSTSEVNYNDFITILDKQDIQEVEVTPGDFVTSIEGIYVKVENGKEVKYTFETNVPNTDQELNSLMQILEDKNIIRVYKRTKGTGKKDSNEYIINKAYIAESIKSKKKL